MLVAVNKIQAQIIKKYISALLDIPLLQGKVIKETAEVIELDNGINIEVRSSDFRSVRGYTIIAAICDEAAYWRSEDSANPDYEVLNAIRPAMSTIPESLLLCISSPYAKRGALYDTYKKFYGKDDPNVLVWQAPTRTMNPAVSQSLINRAMEEDPSSARAEYLAEFRSDIEQLIDRETLEKCLKDFDENDYSRNYTYSAFCDPSGGRSDSFTLAISHRKGDQTIIDAISEVKPPFSPEDAVKEYCQLLRSFRLNTVTGDRYAGIWVQEAFQKQGIKYKQSLQSKSELYLNLLPMINSQKVLLPYHKKLISQLCNLERRTSRSGRDSIDHGVLAHDDLANAVAGAAVLFARPQFVGVPGSPSFYAFLEKHYPEAAQKAQIKRRRDFRKMFKGAQKLSDLTIRQTDIFK